MRYIYLGVELIGVYIYQETMVDTDTVRILGIDQLVMENYYLHLRHLHLNLDIIWGLMIAQDIILEQPLYQMGHY